MESLLKALDAFQGVGQGLLSAPNTLDRLRGEQQETTSITGSNNLIINQNEKILASAYCAGAISDNDQRLIFIDEKFSSIERDFCRRAGSYISQLGYDIFRNTLKQSKQVAGAIPENYILGIGDRIVLTSTGALSGTTDLVINTEGDIVIEKLPPIQAAGKSIGEFKKELQLIIDRYFSDVKVFISIGQVRAINVLVTGEVFSPGSHSANSLSSVLDLLNLAGGIKKSGSLRKIIFKRGKRTSYIDLYNLILGSGDIPDFYLRSGDQIIVPTIGSVLAISGDVRRPTIFEMKEDDLLELPKIIRFGGGYLRPRGNKVTVSTFDDIGRQLVSSVEEGEIFENGDLIIVKRGRDSTRGNVRLTGHVSVPGRRALSNNSTVATLLDYDDSVFQNNPYLFFAVLETMDEVTRSKRYYPLDLQKIMDGEEDFELRDQDNLIVLSSDDIAFLSSPAVQQVISNRSGRNNLQNIKNNKKINERNIETSVGAPTSLDILTQLAQNVTNITGEKNEEVKDDGNELVSSDERVLIEKCGPLDELKSFIKDFGTNRFSNAIISSPEINSYNDNNFLIACPEVYVINPGLISFVLEYATLLLGEVRRPGVYPITEVSMASIVSVAGGLTRDIDLSRTEISNFRAIKAGQGVRQLIDLTDGSMPDIFLRPADVVRFNRLPTARSSGPVVLKGEIVLPGTYQIRRGEKISELLSRAGGLTQQSYPYGAIFLRDRVREAERIALARLSRELNSALAVAAANRRVPSDSFSSFTNLANQLSTAAPTGRVVIEADPTVLLVRPELDIILEPGDQIFIPKRPSSVLVTGDVLNPGAMQFLSGKSINDYIMTAGGFQRSADKNKVFIVLPNGSAEPAGNRLLQYSPTQVPPGSTIVVPKDATPFDIFNITSEVAQLVSQLAITAASLAVIAGN
ncbi:SLBB domain-containing protein [Alphaproteobacteria bacterium]|nr:SLBB domain-containing protein [Alphaproteobacteria bacterium]